MNISKEKIKLLASDLDGTLLNSNKKISEYNQKIIRISNDLHPCSKRTL